MRESTNGSCWPSQMKDGTDQSNTGPNQCYETCNDNNWRLVSIAQNSQPETNAKSDSGKGGKHNDRYGWMQFSFLFSIKKVINPGKDTSGFLVCKRSKVEIRTGKLVGTIPFYGK